MRAGKRGRLLSVLCTLAAILFGQLSFLATAQPAQAGSSPGNQIFIPDWHENLASANDIQNILKSSDDAKFLNQYYPKVAGPYWQAGGKVGAQTTLPTILSNPGDSHCDYSPGGNGGPPNCFSEWLDEASELQKTIAADWTQLLIQYAQVMSDLKAMQDSIDQGLPEPSNSVFNRITQNGSDPQVRLNISGKDKFANDIQTNEDEIDKASVILFKVMMLTDFSQVPGAPTTPPSPWYVPPFAFYSYLDSSPAKNYINQLLENNGGSQVFAPRSNTDEEVMRPTNFALIASGSTGAPDFNSQTSPYLTLADFASDYTLLKSMGRDDFAGSSNMTIKDVYSKVNPIWQKLINNDAGVHTGLPPGASQQSNRCGNSIPLDVVSEIGQAVCGGVVVVADLSGALLRSAIELFASAANMPGADLTNTMFSFLTPSTPNSNGLLPVTFTEPIQTIMVDPTQPSGQAVQKAYNLVLRGLDILLILGLLIAAMANILQVSLNTYAIKKIVPGLIIGFILAHSSYFLVRAGLELSGELSTAFVSFQTNSVCYHTPTKAGKECLADVFIDNFTQVGPSAASSEGPNGVLVDPQTNKLNWSAILQQMVLSILIIVAAVFFFILAFYFLIRALIFFFLTPLAPIAFFSQQVPPLSRLWERWWKLTQGWLLMPVVATFWIWLASVWFLSVNSGTNAGFLTYLMNYIFGMVALYLAMRTPFLLAGEAKVVMDRWNQIGKNTIGRTAGDAAVFTMQKTGLGAIYRGGKKFQTNLSDARKNRINDFYNGPIDQSGKPRKKRAKMSAEVEEFTRKRQEYTKQHSLNGNLEASNKSIAELEDMLEIKERALSRAKDDATRNAIAREIAEDQNKLKQETDSRKKTEEKIEADYKRDNAKDAQREEKLRQDIQNPVTLFERLDFQASKIKAAAEVRKATDEADQNFVDNAAKKALMQGKVGDLAAANEMIRTTTQQLDEITKDLVKAKKSELETTSALVTELRKRQIAEKYNAEYQDSQKEVAFFKHLKSNTDLVTKMVYSEVSGEVREKAKNDVLKARWAVMDKDFGIHDRIKRAIEDSKDATKTDQERAAATARIDNLIGLLSKDSPDQETKMTKEIKKTIEDARASGKSLTTKDIQQAVERGSGLDPDTFKLLKRRVEIKDNGRVKDDSGFMADTGLYRGQLWSGNAEKFEFHITDNVKEYNPDLQASVRAFIDLMSKGDVTGGDAVRAKLGVDQVLGRLSADPSGANQHLVEPLQRLSVVLEDLTTPGQTSQQAARKARAFINSDDAKKLRLSRDETADGWYKSPKE